MATSEPARMAGAAADDLPLPRMHEPTQGDDMSNDERRERYAKALGWRLDDETPGAIRAMLDEQVQRIIAVADAEQEWLRHVEFIHAGCRGLREKDNAHLIARAEAAESALADERAKVARVMSVCSNTDGEWLDGDAEIPVGEVLRMLYQNGDVPSVPCFALDGTR